MPEGWAKRKRTSRMHFNRGDADIIQPEIVKHRDRMCTALLLLLLLMPTAGWSLTMDSSWSENPCPPGKPFYLTINVRWTGDAGHYTPRPPQLDLPQGVRKHDDTVSSRSFRKGQENILSYQWVLIAAEEGEIPSFPVEITVHRQEGKGPSLLEIKTDPLEIKKSNSRTTAFLISLVFLSLFVFILMIFLWRKKEIRVSREKASETPENDWSHQLPKLIEGLNTSRVHGNTLSFLQNALKIIILFQAENQEACREIKALLEECQYGDLKLSGEEMEQWHLRLKRIVPRQLTKEV